LTGLGTINTGVAVFEAADEQAARQVMDDDPIIHARRNDVTTTWSCGRSGWPVLAGATSHRAGNSRHNFTSCRPGPGSQVTVGADGG
jgi:hypothetical protein